MTHVVRWRVFALAAVAINLVAFLMVRVAPRPAVEIGAALDVAVTVPALYFLLIVRGGVMPLISMLPVCLLGMLRATYLAPGTGWARPAVAAGVELALAALIVGRVRRGLKAGGQSGDVLERMEAAALETVPSRRLAAVLASELAVFYYAFAAWRRAPHVPTGARAFSVHQQSGVAALFGVLAGVSVMEAALVHLIVMRWSAAAAWVLTALSGYGAVWLIGDGARVRAAARAGGRRGIGGARRDDVDGASAASGNRGDRVRRGEMRVAGASGERAECDAAAVGSCHGAGNVWDDAAGVEHCTGGGRSRWFCCGCA